MRYENITKFIFIWCGKFGVVRGAELMLPGSTISITESAAEATDIFKGKFVSLGKPALGAVATTNHHDAIFEISGTALGNGRGTIRVNYNTVVNIDDSAKNEVTPQIDVEYILVCYHPSPTLLKVLKIMPSSAENWRAVTGRH